MQDCLNNVVVAVESEAKHAEAEMESCNKNKCEIQKQKELQEIMQIKIRIYTILFCWKYFTFL